MVSGQIILIALVCAGLYYGGKEAARGIKKIPGATHALIHRLHHGK